MSYMVKFSILNGACVERNLTWDTCMAAMRRAMEAISNSDAELPVRSFMPIGGDNGVLAMMPASSSAEGVAGIKVLSLVPGNPQAGRPVIQGYVALFSSATGELAALIDGASLTAIRTASASALATDVLARKDARTHGIFGTGVQARSHAQAVFAARPEISQVLVWGRSQEKAEAAAADIARHSGLVARAATREEAAQCDVISTVTGSGNSILERAMISPGVHINLVGSHAATKREAAADVIAASRIFIDMRKAARAEAGDLLMAMEDGVPLGEALGTELGDVLLQKASGRASEDEITVYKSLGNAAQDLFAAGAALQAAVRSNDRVELDL